MGVETFDPNTWEAKAADLEFEAAGSRTARGLCGEILSADRVGSQGLWCLVFIVNWTQPRITWKGTPIIEFL